MTIKEIGRLISGTAIVTGTAVGAGMLAIPTKTAGLWYQYSLFILVITWAIMMLSGLFILEASQGFDRKDNFPTIVNKILGKRWAAFNSLSLAFVLYILIYAYITAGGGLTTRNINNLFQIDAPLYLGQLLFFGVLGLVVWLSHQWVARLNAIIIGGLFLTFFIAIGGMLPNVQTALLFPNTNGGEWKYLLPTLPVILTSFGYHINVPTLRIYFHDQNKKVALAIIFGTLTALILYLLWQTAIQGNLARQDFQSVIAADGSVAALIHAIDSTANNTVMTRLLSLFSYFAIATSFLGVALGLLEFVADFCQFNFEQEKFGRLKAGLIALLPPLLLALWQPNGFLLAIGYAGLALTVWGLIIPAMMVYKTRQYTKGDHFCVWGGKSMIWLVIIFAAVNIIAQLSETFGLVPIFTG